MRRQRSKSPVNVTIIKRVIAVAGKSGMTVTSLEVRPDGSIVVCSGPAANDDQDVFAAWADKL